MSQHVFLFPGQGSQVVGMGRDFYDNFSVARDVFHEVDDVLAPLYGERLSTVIFEGPSEKLTQTIFTQAALMTVSAAIFCTLEHEFGRPLTSQAAFMIGHSSGEYSALYAAGVLSLRDAALFLYHRGKAMTERAPKEGGGMAAVIGLDFEDVESITKSAGCFVANDNGGGQVVISGEKGAVEKAMTLATAKGAKRAIFLNVSAPFHCPLMENAAQVMEEHLQKGTFHNSLTPVITNIDAKPETKAQAFQEKLVDQICGRVRFRESVLYAFENNATFFIEIGSGKVLSGLTKRITPDAKSQNASSIQDIEGVLKSLA